ATRRTRSGSGAALAMRSRTAAMRSASVPVRGAAGLTAPRRTLLGGAAQPPLLQERGDVELVVAVEVEVVHRRGAGHGLEAVGGARPEDAVGVGVGDAVDELGGLVGRDRPAAAAAGDGGQDAPGALDGGVARPGGGAVGGGGERPTRTRAVAGAHGRRAGVA